MKNNQDGFGLVEGLLVVVVLGIVGFAGWYVWHNKNSTDTPTNTDKVSQVSKEQAQTGSTKTADQTADWTQYESPDKKYKLKIPDGWNFNQNSETTGNLQIMDNKLAIVEGTKGTFYVTPGYGKDYNTGFTIQYCESLNTCISSEGLAQSQEQESLLASTGLTIKKYFYIQTAEPAGPGLPKGGKSYTYIIEKNGKYVVSFYSYDPSQQTDYHAEVEKNLQTIEIE